MTIKNYRDLLAWQQAFDLAEAVHRDTRSFPKEEMYGLTAQMRRAAVSVPSNIAEGQGRRADGPFSLHLSIAHGSLRELETQVLLSGRLGYLSESQVSELLDASSEVGRLVTGLDNVVSGNQG
jgi:four helix bundle protein